jgi:hypothetical protein
MPKAHLVIHVEQDKQLTARSFFSRGHASKLHETAFRGNHAFPPPTVDPASGLACASSLKAAFESIADEEQVNLSVSGCDTAHCASWLTHSA